MLAQADQRHFAYAVAVDCGLRNEILILYLCFVVLLVIVAIIFPLKPD